MFKRFRGKSILKIWTVSYLLIIIVVFLYNLYAINKFSDEINNARNNASEYFLDTMALTFDSVFSDVALLKQDIERNERLYKQRAGLSYKEF